MNGCEGEICITELLEALKSMGNGSAPGIDGITVEFFKVFWNQIGHLLTLSFSSAFDKGHLSPTQCKAVITLIHKGKELPRDDLRNWRPISVTNVDYKILAKSLAFRLNSVIGHVVSEDQYGFIKGRKVANLLRLIDDTIDQLRVTNNPGLLFAVDFSQAFDKISKDYMLEVFKKFGFGPEFIRWVKILMSETKSCINSNGWLSSFFNVETGIRQGCPFSPLAFVLAVELLSIKIKSDNEIKGIKMLGTSVLEMIIKVGLYADDITLFLKDEHDMQLVLNILNKFSQFSGLKVNKRKSEVLWLGLNRFRTNSEFGYTCTRKIKILGIFFSNDKNASQIEDNWKGRILNMKRLVNQWEKRNLSIFGKLLIIKTFLLSQLVYFMQAFVLPDSILSEVNTILFRFLWKKKNCNKRAFEKIKRTIMCSEIEEGGIKMIDIRTMQLSFILKWAVNIFTVKDKDKSTFIATQMYACFGQKGECFYSNVRSKEFEGLDEIQSEFWKLVLKTWLDNNTNHHRTTLLWNNKDIIYMGKGLYLKHWLNGGFVNVSDVVLSDGIITYEDVCNRLGNSPSRFLEYVTVVNAVKRFNKIIGNGIKQELPDIPLFHDKTILNARDFRRLLVAKKKSEPLAVQFWKRKYDVNIVKANWLIANKCTQETRLRVLHWKILNNIYPTNIMLHKMKVKDSNKCSLCPGVVDFIDHFFYECPVIKKFWNKIMQFIYYKIDVKIDINIKEVLFGLTSNDIGDDDLKCINHILLIAKMCVSIFKKTNSPLPIYSIFENQLQTRKL